MHTKSILPRFAKYASVLVMLMLAVVAYSEYQATKPPFDQDDYVMFVAPTEKGKQGWHGPYPVIKYLDNEHKVVVDAETGPVTLEISAAVSYESYKEMQR